MVLLNSKVLSGLIPSRKNDALERVVFEAQSGSMHLMIESTCARITWLHNTTKDLYSAAKGSVTKVGVQFIQSAVHESLFRGLNGHVKVRSGYSSHGFYLNCGFQPLHGTSKYGAFTTVITGELKQLRLHEPKANWGMEALSNSSMVGHAKHILSKEHALEEQHITLDYIHTHWYWGGKYPLTTPQEVISEIQAEEEAAKKENRSPNTLFLGVIDMFLTPQAIDAFKANILSESPLPANIKGTSLLIKKSGNAPSKTDAAALPPNMKSNSKS